MAPRAPHRLSSAAACLVAVSFVAACSGRGTLPGDDVVNPDVQRPDIGVLETGLGDVQPIDPCAPAVCGSRELCGAVVGDASTASGNGLDDDCDGLVDEDCACVPGAAHPCFPAAPDRRNVGACHDGTAACGELESWGTCVGAVVPGAEVCDGVDNDCNGRVDDDVPNCATALRCPANGATRPLNEYTADARAFDATATAFHWTLACPTQVSPCPALASPDDPVVRVRPVQSGTYTLRVALTRGDGTSASCQYPLYVQGAGLRVELEWDTRGGTNGAGTDLDLHVAPFDTSRAQPAAWFTPDDCYYATCAAPGGRVAWATSMTDTRFAPTTDVSVCSGAPPPWGAAWSSSGRCWNPRLDTDNIQCDPALGDTSDPGFCFPENVNVDQPPEDVTFRVAVNFYRDHGTCTDTLASNDVTHPRLLVYCGGLLRAELGGVEDGEVPMACARNPGLGSSNWTWLAADVRFFTNACGLADCLVRPLRGRATAWPACDTASDASDVCEDGSGRVFVRRAGARPIDAELARSL